MWQILQAETNKVPFTFRGGVVPCISMYFIVKSSLCRDWSFFPNSFSYGVFANIGSGAVPGRLPGGRFREVPGRFRAGSEPPVPGRFRGRVLGHGSGKVPRQGGSEPGSGHENDPVADGGIGFRDGSRTVLARFLDGMVPERIENDPRSRRHQKRRIGKYESPNT